MNGQSFRQLIVALALGVFASSFASIPAFAQSLEATSVPKILSYDEERDVRYFQLQPFNVPVIRNGKLAQMVSVAVIVEVRGVINQGLLMEKRQRLRDAFLRDIHGVASLQRADGRVMDSYVLKTRLMMVSERVLGPGIIDDILVNGISDRNP